MEEIEKKISAESESTNMKTRSIRADENVLNKFVQLSKEFGNQSECLAQLVSTWELHNASTALPDMATDIADIEAHLQALQAAYVHILELNANADERVGMEYKTRLESKDKSISDYQTKLKEAENTLAEAKAEVEATQTKLADTQDKVSALEADKESLVSDMHEKIDYISSLNAQLSDFRAERHKYQEADKRIQELQASKEEAEKQTRRLEKEVDNLNATIVNNQKTAENELIKAVSEAEKQCRKIYDRKIDEKQGKIDELTEDKVRLTNENAQLKIQVALFEKANPSKAE